MKPWIVHVVGSGCDLLSDNRPLTCGQLNVGRIDIQALRNIRYLTAKIIRQCVDLRDRFNVGMRYGGRVLKWDTVIEQKAAEKEYAAMSPLTRLTVWIVVSCFGDKLTKRLSS